MSKNELLFVRSQKTIPGGVNSPVRAFRAVEGTPRFIVRGEGSRIWDADDREYVDYVGSWGPLVLGHADPDVVAAVREAAGRGLSFGAPTELEAEMAEALTRLVPGMELVRLVSSGTEATMSALRLARGATGRSRIVKFEGCYHGHADGLHLGREDIPIRAARAKLGDGMLLGASCYDRVELALAARDAGADYVAFGSAFPSTTKPGATRASFALYREAKARLNSPIVAIGGITPENAQTLIAAGVDAVAVISALFDAPDIAAAARSFDRLFDKKRK